MSIMCLGRTLELGKGRALTLWINRRVWKWVWRRLWRCKGSPTGMWPDCAPCIGERLLLPG